MAIFNTRSVLTESYIGDVSDVMESVQGTTESLDAIMLEFCEFDFKLQSGLRIADVAIESKALYEGVDPTVLVEGTLKDVLNKIKTALTDFFKKIKAWFSKMIENIKIFFMKGSDFVKKYEKEIKAKAAKSKKYTYVGFAYSLSDLKSYDSEAFKSLDNAQNAAKLVRDTFDKYNRKDDAISNGDKADFLNKIEGFKTSNSYSDNIDNDYVGKYITKVRGGRSTKSDITGFSANSVDAMIKFITDYSKTLSNLKEYDSQCASTGNKILSNLNSIKDSDTSITEALTKVVSIVKANVNFALRVANATVSLTKEIYRTFVGALKGLMLKKVQEAVEIDISEDEGLDDLDTPDDDDEDSDEDDEVAEESAGKNFLTNVINAYL